MRLVKSRRIVSMFAVAFGGATFACLPGAVSGQTPTFRPLGRIVATTSAPLGAIANAIEVGEGRVLAHDYVSRRVVLFDSTLKELASVLDTTGSTNKAYGSRQGALIPYRPDTSLFLDVGAGAFLVLANGANTGRVAAVPRVSDITSLTTPNVVGFDGLGRLTYRTGPPRAGRLGGSVTASGSQAPDSAAIIQVDMRSRAVDTVALLRVFREKTLPGIVLPNGMRTVPSIHNPLPIADDWTILPNGSVVVVRGQDFRVEWTNPDGSKGTSAKVDWGWQRLTDSGKQAVIDSARRVLDSVNASRGLGGLAVQFVAPTDLPDYRPPFHAPATLADADGRAWIQVLPDRPTPGGPFYLVIDSTDRVVDRIQIPGGCTIVGFGHGVVYMTSRVGAGVQLARASIR